MPVYRRTKSNIRRPAVRRRRSIRSRASYARPRTYRRRTTRRAAPCKCPQELTPTAKFAIAQLDPFHPNALGAKVPDTNTMPSIANVATDQVACQAATSGFLTGFAFRPYYNQAVIQATPVDANTVSWGAAVATNSSNRRDFTNFVAQMEAVRPVAHAVRVSSSLAPTSCTGFVHIGLSVESNYGNAAATWQFPTTVNQMTGLAYYKRVTLASLTQSPLTVINKWIDERGFQYEDANQSATITTGTAGEVTSPFGWSWANIVILVEGAVAGSIPLSAEHLLLTESLPKKDSILIGSQAAPNSPGVMSAVSTMSGEVDFTHTEATQDGYIAQGLESFGRGAAQAGEAAWNNVAVPLLQRVGQVAGTAAARTAAQMLMGRGGLPGVNANINRLALN